MIKLKLIQIILVNIKNSVDHIQITSCIHETKNIFIDDNLIYVVILE